MTIHFLIHKLKQLENNDEVKYYLIDDLSGDGKYFNETIDIFRKNASKELLNLVYEIMPLLSRNLVLWNGMNNYENIELIREAGFEIIPGDTDSQGPTNMVIKLKDFKIMYV